MGEGLNQQRRPIVVESGLAGTSDGCEKDIEQIIRLVCRSGYEICQRFVPELASCVGWCLGQTIGQEQQPLARMQCQEHRFISNL